MRYEERKKKCGHRVFVALFIIALSCGSMQFIQVMQQEVMQHTHIQTNTERY